MAALGAALVIALTQDKPGNMFAIPRTPLCHWMSIQLQRKYCNVKTSKHEQRLQEKWQQQQSKARFSLY